MQSPIFEVRDKAHKIADNKFFTLVAPFHHRDADVDFHLKRLYYNHWWPPHLREEWLYYNNPRLYLRVYLVPRMNCVFTDYQVLSDYKCQVDDTDVGWYWEFRDEFGITDRNWNRFGFLEGFWNTEDVRNFRDFVNTHDPTVRKAFSAIAGASANEFYTQGALSSSW